MPSTKTRRRAVSTSRRRPKKGRLPALAKRKEPAWPDEVGLGMGPGQKSTRRPQRHRIRVGTASWSDPGFIADWYPQGLPPARRLPWYAEHFDLVEVNSTFYAVPAPEVVARWSKQTPEDFLFDVKLHRLLSRHSTPVNQLPRGLRRRARTTPKGRVQLTPQIEEAMVDFFLGAIEPLRESGKLGALLLQLSPSFGPRDHALAELDSLLDQLAGYEVAVELRNRGWVAGERREETIAFFRKRRVALVAVDAPRRAHFMIVPDFNIVTDPKLAYLRAHGRNARGYISGRSVAERFDYKYSDKELKEIAARAKKLAQVAVETHVIYNNNKSSYAPQAASRFREIIGATPLAAKTE